VSADQESKTEEPTEKRRQEALARGDAPIVRDALLALSLIGFAIACAEFASSQARQLSAILASLLDHAGRIRIGGESEFPPWAREIVVGCVQFLALPLGGTLGIVIGGALALGKGHVVWNRVAPDFARISMQKGISRLFSRQGLGEFAKSVAKLLLFGCIALAYLARNFGSIGNAADKGPFESLQLAGRELISLSSWIACAAVAIGCGSYLAARFAWTRKQRMTRQEVRDELKQSEGDPIVKSRMRSLARDRARRRMIDNVDRATVVLVNPTHYAVALRYLREEGGAPLVVAKGTELLALRIREQAERLNIPIVENPPLARSLYAGVDVDQMIPPEFYRAIAEVINTLSGRGIRPVDKPAH
jgi:flagellar biosynthesis protein FlhB